MPNVSLEVNMMPFEDSHKILSIKVSAEAILESNGSGLYPVINGTNKGHTDRLHSDFFSFLQKTE